MFEKTELAFRRFTSPSEHTISKISTIITGSYILFQHKKPLFLYGGFDWKFGG